MKGGMGMFGGNIPGGGTPGGGKRGTPGGGMGGIPRGGPEVAVDKKQETKILSINQNTIYSTYYIYPAYCYLVLHLLCSNVHVHLQLMDHQLKWAQSISALG